MNKLKITVLTTIFVFSLLALLMMCNSCMPVQQAKADTNYVTYGNLPDDIVICSEITNGRITELDFYVNQGYRVISISTGATSDGYKGNVSAVTSIHLSRKPLIQINNDSIKY